MKIKLPFSTKELQPTSMKSFFSFKKRVAYRFAKLWRKLQYAKFFLFKNAEFDQGYLLEFLELKLTMMGIYFAKFGIVIDVDRKKQVHTIWQARKHLQNYINSSDIILARGQKKFIEKYGVPYELGDMITKPCDNGGEQLLGWKVASPKNLTAEQEKEVNDYWHSECFNFEKENKYSEEQLKQFWKIFSKNLCTWWD